MGMGSVFMITLILAFAVIFLAIRPTKSEKAVQQRLKVIEGAAAGSADIPTDLLKSETLSEIPWLDDYMHKFRVFPSLHRFIAQADSQRTVGELVVGSLFLGIAAAWLSSFWLRAIGLSVLAGGAAAAVPYVYLYVMRAQRFKHFEEHLPDAIDLMSRALRAGHAISSAIEMVSEESSEPVASEFRRVFEQQNFGLPIREALLHLTDRVPLADVRFLVTAILVQKETGGNLAEILDKTVTVIRERFRLRGQLRIYTAQGRLTGWILSVLPFALFLAISILSPTYEQVLLTDPVGRYLIYVGLAMMAFGGWVIRRIIDVKV